MRTVAITGVNRGLGFEFARQYRAEGWRVIGTVRSKHHAGDGLAALGVELHELDLNDFSTIAAFGRTLQDDTIDVILANAGHMGARDMPIDDVDLEAWELSFRVNAIAPVALQVRCLSRCDGAKTARRSQSAAGAGRSHATTPGADTCIEAPRLR